MANVEHRESVIFAVVPISSSLSLFQKVVALDRLKHPVLRSVLGPRAAAFPIESAAAKPTRAAGVSKESLPADL